MDPNSPARPDCQPEAPITWLSEEELRTASVALRLATQQSVSLNAALAWYVTSGRMAEEAPNLGACVEAFLRRKGVEGLRPDTMKDYRVVLRRFAKPLPERPPAFVSAAEIGRFISQWENPFTRHSAWRTLKTFFGWLVNQGHVLRNPVTRAMCPPDPPQQPGRIYSPGDARFILCRTAASAEILYWALALFSGLRSREIERVLEHPLPWTLIRPSAGVITLPGAASKTGPRIIPILPVLRRWLHWVQARGIELPIPNLQKKIARTRAAVRQRSHSAEPGGGTRHNMARRSYISYRLALNGATYLDVGSAAGNSEPTIRRFYRTPVDPADARSYFRLSPRIVLEGRGR